MKQTAIKLNEMKLVGITCRTNNNLEMDPSTAQIGATLQAYFGENLPATLVNRKNPGTTYCVYTDYESDVTGDYTYFVGEEITSLDTIPNGLVALTIPAQHYTKFTTKAGSMPMICISAWQKIWAMSPREVGGERNYVADFEIYDNRALDPQNTILDIYIGLKK
ncbi:GyrI-like domain-containing protein [Candidatus Odyssella acanthamoebae]|uniref:Transcriptional regulator n=1 Tax=Candidatus Odyssella acanthamoebae TaxID=91604 RepID=A0A077AZG7_9PROT|nr:GyrI-like domain-containing protein [Candidatus Paracaedibacter acanthamoebae]AIK97083.1 transcriptional regulator [Candidatus Paracaedibacter acanthamoebae]